MAIAMLVSDSYDWLALQTQRIGRGWSVARLASEAGVHDAAAENALAGRASITVVRRVCKALGLSFRRVYAPVPTHRRRVPVGKRPDGVDAYNPALLRAALEQDGETTAGAARAAGVSHNAAKNVLRGQGSLASVRRMCCALGIDPLEVYLRSTESG